MTRFSSGGISPQDHLDIFGQPPLCLYTWPAGDRVPHACRLRLGHEGSHLCPAPCGPHGVERS